MLALFQFDAASLPLVNRMLDDGQLPVLRALKERGRWLELDAEATLLQSSTYPTLYTGVDVRRHGIYSTFPWSASEQRVKFAHTFAKPATIWERLTEQGIRSLVIDPYLSWPPTRMKGVFLSGVHFEDRMALRSASVPRHASRGAHSLGRVPKLHDVYGVHDIGSLNKLRDRLVEAPRRAADATIGHLATGAFDLLWLNFAAAHKAGHQLWNADAASGADADTAGSARLHAGLCDIYRSIDNALGRVIQALPDNADIIVFSPTGMAANTSRADLLPRMLRAVLDGDNKSRRKATNAPVWRLRSSIPVEWRARIANALPDRLVADLTTRLHMSANWGVTRAFTIPGENKGYIRLNLQGRERLGIVGSHEVDSLVDQIVDGLKSFRDPDGGDSVERVERIQDLAGGESCSPMLPDLIVYWGQNPPVRMSHVSSLKFGDVARAGVGSGRSGNHVDEAWAVLAPGRSRFRDPGRRPRITDIGATACSLLGARTDGLSGEALLERENN